MAFLDVFLLCYVRKLYLGPWVLINFIYLVVKWVGICRKFWCPTVEENERLGLQKENLFHINHDQKVLPIKPLAPTLGALSMTNGDFHLGSKRRTNSREKGLSESHSHSRSVKLPPRESDLWSDLTTTILSLPRRASSIVLEKWFGQPRLTAIRAEDRGRSSEGFFIQFRIIPLGGPLIYLRQLI